MPPVKLKATLKSLDSLPEDLHDLYTEVDGEFVLNVEDGDFKKRLSEFRNNNIDMAKKLEAAQEQITQLAAAVKQFEGLDPKLARDALDKMRANEDKKLLDEGKIEELIAQRTERMRQDHLTQVDALSKKLEAASGEAKTFKSRLYDHMIDSSLQTAVTGVAAVRPGAMRDILARGRSLWRLEDNGDLVPRNEKGDILYGKDGTRPMTMDEWSQGLLQEAPYLFEGSAGGGSRGNAGDGDRTGLRMVKVGDQDSLNQNLEAIAAGKVQVVD